MSLAVGVVVTLLSAWLPARRAAKVAPIAALRDVAVDRSAASARRAVAGSVVTGRRRRRAARPVSAGRAGARRPRCARRRSSASSVLGPVLARPVASRARRPAARLRGIAGELARPQNAMRNPKRTARTAVVAHDRRRARRASSRSSPPRRRPRSPARSSPTSPARTSSTPARSTAPSGSAPSWPTTLRGDPRRRRRQPGPGDPGERRRRRRRTPFIAFDATTDRRAVRARHGRGRPRAARRRRHRRASRARHGQRWTLGDTVTVTFPSGDTTLHGRGDLPRTAPSGSARSSSASTAFAGQRADAARRPGLRRHGDEAAIEPGGGRRTRRPTVLDKDGFLDAESAEIDMLLNLVYAMLDAGRRDRPARHRQHAGAVDLRADSVSSGCCGRSA